jgi:pyruvate-formate lyase-activating enzyme
VRERGFRIYLETAGLHAKALKVVDYVDVIAMDVKPNPRRVWRTGTRPRLLLRAAGRTDRARGGGKRFS